jgi:hypothetical protein
MHLYHLSLWIAITWTEEINQKTYYLGQVNCHQSEIQKCCSLSDGRSKQRPFGLGCLRGRGLER